VKKRQYEQPLKLLESLDSFAGAREDAENVKSDRLAQRPALSNSNLVTLLNTESRGDMSGDVLMALLVTVVLGDVVEVVSPDNKSSMHLGGDDGAGQDTATDGDETSERTLLVNVRTVDCSVGGLEAQSNILVPSPSSFPNSALRGTGLLGGEDVRLLLESTLRLDGKLSGHLCRFAG